jgi:UBX domain-containing protein 1
MADNVSDEQVQQFSAITGAPPRIAAQFIALSGGNIETALASYYASQDDGGPDDANDSDYMDDDAPEQNDTSRPAPAETTSAGGHRLGDPSTSTPATASAPSTAPKRSNQQKKFATINDVGSNRKDDDDSGDDDRQDFFAGGEKSGLAVQNPDDLKKRILEKAQKTGPPPKDAPAKKTFFKGAAHTLGSEDTPSQAIPAAPQSAGPPERVERTLHFWTDGFSVDDGDLYRSDDPRNAELLELIQRGRAPLRIMNVLPGQEVDVEIKEHKEKYVKPKKKYQPFGGSGNRLGSPTPAVGGMQSMPGAFETAPESSTIVAATAPTSGPATITPQTNYDESQPAITVRISLGSGTRLTSRFNATQTIGDLYDFVRRAEPGGREFVMQTTFPSKELKDTSQQFGDIAELKRGGAVVQKFI